jgi:uncharacterized protein (DUF2237 family)|tara:strand:- start:622 stop:999 length:378 start_codon:yes stop_codon:yes gene_type:complete
MTISKQLNVFGNKLIVCSNDPLTGFFRDGCCNSSHQDRGNHSICAVVTNEFLQFSLKTGNNLITPKEEFSFPGLVAGDKWCLCVNRWIDALNNNCAPKILLEATNQKVLNKVNMQILKKFALDIN